MYINLNDVISHILPLSYINGRLTVSILFQNKNNQNWQKVAW